MQIKNRYTDEVIYECEAENFKECVERAVKEKANLRKADLRKANLSEANLSEANLSEANLRKANLRKADLRKADLNAVFYKTKVTKEQKEQIVESDLFEVVDDSTSNSMEKKN